MSEQLIFENRQKFRQCLSENCRTSGGVVIVFGKRGGPTTLTLEEAQEEAVCFGWVDSLMHRLALEGHEPACSNFIRMSPSVQRTYTALYFDAKTEQTRIARPEKIVSRLDNDLKPM